MYGPREKSGDKKRLQELRLLKKRVTEMNYEVIELARDGLPERKELISRLMLSTFVRRPVPGEEADHMNPLETRNNFLSNLQWLTKKENLAKRTLQTGTRHHTKRNPGNISKILQGKLRK